MPFFVQTVEHKKEFGDLTLGSGDLTDVTDDCVQICLLFPGSFSHHQKQEKGQDLRAVCHYGYDQWFVKNFTQILEIVATDFITYVSC